MVLCEIINEKCKILTKKKLEDNIGLKKQDGEITKVYCWFIESDKTCRQKRGECKYHPLYY